MAATSGCRPFALAKEDKMNHTTFIAEGPTIMPPAAIVEFMARCLLILVLTMISQLPSNLNVKIDADAFLGSFHYTDENGASRRVDRWLDGPGWRKRQASDNSSNTDAIDRPTDLEDQKEHIAILQRKWEEHENRCGAHIPSALCTVAGITPLVGWTEGQPLQKMKPLLFPRKTKKKKKKGGKKVATEGWYLAIHSHVYADFYPCRQQINTIGRIRAGRDNLPAGKKFHAVGK